MKRNFREILRRCCLIEEILKVNSVRDSVEYIFISRNIIDYSFNEKLIMAYPNTLRIFINPIKNPNNPPSKNKKTFL